MLESTWFSKFVRTNVCVFSVDQMWKPMEGETGERDWKEATWRDPPQSPGRSRPPQLGRRAWKLFPESQTLPSRTPSKEPVEASMGENSLLNAPTRTRKNKTDDVTT